MDKDKITIIGIAGGTGSGKNHGERKLLRLCLTCGCSARFLFITTQRA